MTDNISSSLDAADMLAGGLAVGLEEHCALSLSDQSAMTDAAPAGRHDNNVSFCGDFLGAYLAAAARDREAVVGIASALSMTDKKLAALMLG